MSLFWTFAFTGLLIYLSVNLVLNIDTIDGWLKALYFVVLIPGYGVVVYQIRIHFKTKYENGISR